MRWTWLAVVALVVGCGGAGPQFQWPRLVECAAGVPDAIGKVSTILIADKGDHGISEDAGRQLLDLGKQVGGDAVVCAVQRLVTDWLAPGAAQAPEQLAAAARGKAWLAQVGTEVR